MNGLQLRITHHAHKRYRQRVGGMSRQRLYRRTETALRVGLYQQGEGVIKLCGIWWGCVVRDRQLILTTCFGYQPYNMIKKRIRDKVVR